MSTRPFDEKVDYINPAQKEKFVFMELGNKTFVEINIFEPYLKLKEKYIQDSINISINSMDSTNSWRVAIFVKSHNHGFEFSKDASTNDFNELYFVLNALCQECDEIIQKYLSQKF
jgi:hypothetical protein